MTPLTADSPLGIYTHDLHDAALYVWRAGRRRDCALVHLDAHLDCGPLEGTHVHIGNFVRAGIVEGLISRVVWVVPDPVWGSPESRDVLARELRKAADTRPAGWTARVAGAPVTVCALADLPRLSGAVHLDIDIDYLFYRARQRDDDRPFPLPWLWPRELAPALSGLGLSVETITIASSITGGFTPLRWKHLAHDLAVRLGDDSHGSAALEAYESLASAAVVPLDARVSALRQVVLRDPDNAAASFHLAEALQSSRALDEARRMFSVAVSLDPEYRHLYRSEGPLEQGIGRRASARVEYERALQLDPLDPFSRIGLAQLAEDAGRETEARDLFEAALSQPRGDLIDACRGLARLLERDNPGGAIAAYERSLKLALAGQVPLSAPPCTNREGRLVDPAHFTIYGRIGRLHERVGDTRAARVNYVLAATREPRYRLRLGWLRLRERDPRGALDCLQGMAALITRAVRRAFGATERAWYNPGLP